MVTRALTLEGAGLTLELEGLDGFAALQGGSGFGLAKRTNRWARGAGHGRTHMGARVDGRTLPLPLLIRGRDADHLQERLSMLAVMFDPRNAPARLRLSQGQEAWSCPVVLGDEGGDYVYGRDTNGSTWVELPDAVLESESPYWVRERPELVPIRAGGLGRGLLGQSDTPDVPPGEEDGDALAYGEGAYGAGDYGGGGQPAPQPGGTGNSLTRLRLSSGQAMGPTQFQNPGDAEAPPLVTVHGPATRLLSQSPTGETLEWNGNLLAREHLFIDHTTGTVTDDTGASRYTELGAAPRFWQVPPATSTGFVTLEGATRDSGVDVLYHPHRWLVI